MITTNCIDCIICCFLGVESGVCSWYGDNLDGALTASGERFNSHDMTAAHNTLPFGTRVRVTIGSRWAVLRINDRGPFGDGRILDVTPVAAKRLGFRDGGIVPCTVERI